MRMNQPEEKPWLLYLSLSVLLIASLYWAPRLWRLYHHGAQDAAIANLKQIDAFTQTNNNLTSPHSPVP